MSTGGLCPTSRALQPTMAARPSAACAMRGPHQQSPCGIPSLALHCHRLAVGSRLSGTASFGSQALGPSKRAIHGAPGVRAEATELATEAASTVERGAPGTADESPSVVSPEAPQPPAAPQREVKRFQRRLRVADIKGGEDEGVGRIGTEVTVRGWVRTIRVQKTFAFIEVNDGSSLAGLQVVMTPDAEGYAQVEGGEVGTGAAISVEGAVVASQGAKQKIEIKASKLVLVGAADGATYPLQKKRHTMEYLRTIAHLRPRTNTMGAVSRVRSALAFATHQFFRENGFTWVASPIITASDCEGAGEQFCVTTLIPASHLDTATQVAALPTTKEGALDWSQDFFGKPAFLTVSGQLNAEIYATALSNVYTFGPTFRAENSNTSRHLAEFWMIEPELAFADLEDNMACATAFLKHVVRYVLENCQEDMQFFDKFVEKDIVRRLQDVAGREFAHITYTDAVALLKKSKKKFEFPVEWGVDLQSEHERHLTEDVFAGQPLIVTDYPKEIKAFYMRENEDGRTVAAMDVLVPRVGELMGGSQREERLSVLERKLDDNKLSRDAYWWYLDLRRYGSVPHAGFGLGFERLVQFCTGVDNIRDAIPFPRVPGSAEF